MYSNSACIQDHLYRAIKFLIFISMQQKKMVASDKRPVTALGIFMDCLEFSVIL